MVCLDQHGRGAKKIQHQILHVSRHESDLVPSSEKWRFRHLFSKSLRVLHFLSAGGTAGEEDHCGCALT